MEINIEYEATNKIYLNNGYKKILVLSDENKEISAKEILEFLDYKKGKKYVLRSFSEDIFKLDENNKNYIEQIHKMMTLIVDGINAIT